MMEGENGGELVDVREGGREGGWEGGRECGCEGGSVGVRE